MIGKILITFGLLACAAPLAYAQIAECSDGSMSSSANFHGTCSDHGGVAVWWNDEGIKDEANQWCETLLCVKGEIWARIEEHGDQSDDEAVRLQPRQQKPACDRRFPMDCPNGKQ
jgi:hypothetical protein